MRTLNDAKLGTREARLKLRTEKRHWRQIEANLHIGYRRGPRGGKWVIRVYTEGRYMFETLGIADDFTDADGAIILSFDQAQNLARKRFVRMRRTAKGLNPELPHGKYSVNQCLDDYLDTLDGATKKSVESNFRVHIRPVLGHMDWEDLTKKILQKWLKDDADKPPTRARDYDKDDPENIRKRNYSANTRWAHFHTALRRAAKEKELLSGPWDLVEKFKNVDKRDHTFFEPKECRRLARAASRDFAKLLQGALHTGARQFELARVLVGDFNGRSRSLHIRYGKGGKPRHIYLNSEGLVFFRRITQGRPKGEHIFLTEDGMPWKQWKINREMHATLDRAGIVVPRGTNMHACRHTYCSLALMSGLDLMPLAENLGHADTRMVEKVYGHLSRKFLRDEISRHAPSFGFE